MFAFAVNVAEPSAATDCGAESAVATAFPAASKICQRTRQLSGFVAFVLHDRAQTQRGRVALDARPNIALPLPQMQRIRLGQPDMPVNSGAFVEPAIAEARVHAHHQIILPAIVQEVSQVEDERRVAVVVAADEVSVQKDQRAAEGAIELDA